MCSKSLKGMAIVKLYKNIKISEASAAPENRFLMRCTVSGVHLTGGMLLHDNRAFIGLSNDSPILFCKEDVHNAQLHRIQFREADEFSLKAEEVPTMV